MDEYARKHGEHDLVRLGLFVEMPYLSWGKSQATKKPKKPVMIRPMYGSVPKSKCANQDGYFEEEFKRVFGGEYRKQKSSGKKIKLKIAFTPTGPGKLHSTPNDYFGCFYEEPPERFSPQLRLPKKPKGKKQTKMSKPNPMTNPGKKGGPGYVDICINEYPEHLKDPCGPKPLKKEKTKKHVMAPFYSGFYPIFAFQENPYFDEKDDPPKKPTYINKEKEIKPKVLKPIFIPTNPAKLMGNNHDGCFDPYPEHIKDLYLSPWQIKNFVKLPKGAKKPPKHKGIPYIPPYTEDRTMYNPSVLISTGFTMNETNWKTYSPNYVKYL